jgi:hypothetical protein
VKTEFRDRHDRVDYLKACEVARRLRADPSLLESGRRFLEKFVLTDEHARPHGERWLALLDGGAERVAALLEEDSPQGQLARETRPVFGPGLTSREVARLLEAAG